MAEIQVAFTIWWDASYEKYIKKIKIKIKDWLWWNTCPLWVSLGGSGDWPKWTLQIHRFYFTPKALCMCYSQWAQGNMVLYATDGSYKQKKQEWE